MARDPELPKEEHLTSFLDQSAAIQLSSSLSVRPDRERPLTGDEHGIHSRTQGRPFLVHMTSKKHESWKSSCRAVGSQNHLREQDMRYVHPHYRNAM